MADDNLNCTRPSFIHSISFFSAQYLISHAVAFSHSTAHKIMCRLFVSVDNKNQMASIESSEFEFCIYVSQMSLELNSICWTWFFFFFLFVSLPVSHSFHRHWLRVYKWNVVGTKSKRKKALMHSEWGKKRECQAYNTLWDSLNRTTCTGKKKFSQNENTFGICVLHTLSTRRRYYRSNNRHNYTQQCTYGACVYVCICVL